MWNSVIKKINNYEKAFSLINYIDNINKDIDLLRSIKQDLLMDSEFSNEQLNYYRYRDKETFTKKDLEYIAKTRGKYSFLWKKNSKIFDKTQ